MQSRQQVSGQTKSPVFDTEQIIVTLSLLFTCAGVRFLYFIISLVCAQGHLLSILPGDLSSNSSREGNDVREEVLHHDGFQILGLIILLLQVATQQKKPNTTTPKTKEKTSLKFSEPSSNSLEAQYFANGILFVSPLVFVTHRALIPFVLFWFVLFFHNMFLCQQANSLIHHSLQSAVNSIFIPGGTSLLLPFSIPFLTSL